jgi:hypothetical protein
MEIMILDLLYGVLIKPEETFKDLAQKKPLIQSIIVFLLVWLFISLPGSKTNEGYVLSHTIRSFLWLVVVSVLLHALSRLFTQQGDFRSLLTGLGFAQFPLLLTLPVAALNRVVDMQFVPFMNLINIAISIWVVILCILAFKEIYRLNTAHAVLCYVLLALVPVALILSLFLFIFIFAYIKM